MFFKILLRYPTTSYSKIIAIAQSVYNNSDHRAIYSLKPHRVHFDNAAASFVLRNNLKKYEHHKKGASSIYCNLSKDQRLNIGDTVRLRNPKPIIRKESSVFFPSVTEETFKITNICKKDFPYVYQLSGKQRRYYAWHLVKVNEKIIQQAQNYKKNPLTLQKLYVKNAFLRPSRHLRSGRATNSDLVYAIQKDNSDTVEYVSKNVLSSYIKLFGKDAINYDKQFFENPTMKSYVI